ncbi:hypothetical protein Q1695_014314 [Nippostrongylus brasiliensis]|nr:hypothetical protein Q1695_014314 [Nippostrongylus brasiliensis]
MSTSPRSNITKLQESHNTERSSGIDASTFSEAAVAFTRSYFSGSKISEDAFGSVVKLIAADDHFHSIFISSVVCSEVLERYPIRKSYRRSILKLLISELESINVEVEDALYATCADCMLDSWDNCFRVFLSKNLDEILVVIRESTQQLCHGTTGLSLWQASCDLANFLCQFADLSGKRILELGAGCGLTGIALARSFPVCSVCLSDYDPKVLSQLEFNIEENKDKKCSAVSVLNIDWNAFDIKQLSELPDVVVAADVVYDCSVLPSLCRTIRACLCSSAKSCAYIASTVRDPMTLRTFRDNLEAHDLRISDEVQYQYGTFTFLDGSKCRSTSIFPYSSTLDAPTLIFEVVFDAAR